MQHAVTWQTGALQASKKPVRVTIVNRSYKVGDGCILFNWWLFNWWTVPQCHPCVCVFQQKIIMRLWRKQAVRQMKPGMQSLSGMTPNTTAVAPMGHTPSCGSVKALCSICAD